MLTVIYGAETWCLNAREKWRLNVMEMNCLSRTCGVTVMDRTRRKWV